jgi:hypothetical protein
MTRQRELGTGLDPKIKGFSPNTRGFYPPIEIHASQDTVEIDCGGKRGLVLEDLNFGKIDVNSNFINDKDHNLDKNLSE